MTAFTTMSADRNIDQGERSRGIAELGTMERGAASAGAGLSVGTTIG
jgi:hypothetical protein